MIIYFLYRVCLDTGGLRKGGNIEMKEGFQIGRTDGRIYAMGVTCLLYTSYLIYFDVYNKEYIGGKGG